MGPVSPHERPPMPAPLPIARNAAGELALLPALANRHGLIAGATGTGKTVTLQVLAEEFSSDRRAGVHGRRQGRPVGHQPGRRARSDKLAARLKATRRGRASPSRRARSCSGTCSASRAIRCAPPSRRWGRCCWRACSTSTTRRRACSRSCSRSPTTTACCCSTSRTCAPCCSTSATTPQQFQTQLRQRLGRDASAPSSAGCSRSSSRAASKFFGEPALNLDDLMQTDAGGRGVINILAADKLMQSPQALRDVPAVAAVGAVRAAARGRRSATSRSSSSSSTRRTCSSTMRRRRCWTRSSRSCG